MRTDKLYWCAELQSCYGAAAKLSAHKGWSLYYLRPKIRMHAHDLLLDCIYGSISKAIRSVDWYNWLYEAWYQEPACKSCLCLHPITIMLPTKISSTLLASLQTPVLTEVVVGTMKIISAVWHSKAQVCLQVQAEPSRNVWCIMNESGQKLVHQSRCWDPGPMSLSDGGKLKEKCVCVYTPVYVPIRLDCL